MHLELPPTKKMEESEVDGLNVRNFENLPIKWVETRESITQEVNDVPARQDILGWAKVANLK